MILQTIMSAGSADILPLAGSHKKCPVCNAVRKKLKSTLQQAAGNLPGKVFCQF
jgi:hypothetical protein